MINLHWSTLVYGAVLIVLLALSLWPRESNAGNYTPDTSALANLFWFVVTALFTLIWGGIFWW